MTAPAPVRIIAVGDELLEGRTSDTNSTRIQRALGAHAVVVRDIAVVHDRLEDIAAALDRTDPLDVVFICGGLGGTVDDLTRNAVAAWADVDLIPDEEAFAALRRAYARRGLQSPGADDPQAMLPAGCRPLPNPVGSAPGLVGILRERRVVMLPGVPAELAALLPGAVEVLTALQALPSARPTRLWRVAQMAELAVARLTEPVRAQQADLDWSWWLVEWGVDVRVGGDSSRAGVLDEVATSLDRILGDTVYAREMVDLPGVVQDKLLARRQTLAVAESCTGGLLGAAITSQAGSSGYYRGGALTYANQAKIDLLGVDVGVLAEHGAVSKPVAEQMALGAQNRLGTDYALSVTGIAGPGGGTDEKPVGTTWIALASPTGVVAGHYRFTADRHRGRQLAVNSALDMLRRGIDGLPVVAPERLTWGVEE